MEAVNLKNVGVLGDFTNWTLKRNPDTFYPDPYKGIELLTPYISAADVLITTAAVPGRTAPRLVTAQMISHMAAGSVVVDLAAESGGNVEGSVAGEIITTATGVRIWGGKDVPSQLAFVLCTRVREIHRFTKNTTCGPMAQKYNVK